MSVGETVGSKFEAAKNAIRENFDRGAGDYARFEERNCFFRELLAELLKFAPPKQGSKILDIGCGTGASLGLLIEAAGEGGEVYGLDNSQGMLDEAAKKFGGRVSLHCADGCEYGGLFPPEFDLVVYNAVLFLLPDAESSLKCAHRVLKTGGAALFSNLDGLLVDGTPVADVLAAAGYSPGRHFLSPWSKVEEAARTVFGGFEARALERPLPVELFRQFYGLIPMSAGLLPKTPYPERLKIVNDIADKWAREGTPLTQRWMLGYAKKAG